MPDYIFKTVDEFVRTVAALSPSDTATLAFDDWIAKDGAETFLEIADLRGTHENPIVFRATGTIDCNRTPCPDDERESFSLLRFTGCRHVVVEGFTVQNCWPAIVVFNKCRDIAVRRCTFRDGTTAIVAKKSRNIDIEGNSWQQDTSDDHRLWTEVDWAEAHGGEGKTGTEQYWNGAFFWSKNASRVRIAGNLIEDAYNGIRMKTDRRWVWNDMPENSDVIIEGNTFRRIRDNPVEPERFAYNWHIRHNLIEDGYAWFSLDGVMGGYVYIYGNVATFTSRPGKPGAKHVVGRVLKLSYLSVDDRYAPGRLTPSRPWYVVNNSFYLQCPVISGSAPTLANAVEGCGPDLTRYLTFANNVLEWGEDRPATVENFAKRDDDHVVFTGNMANRPDFFGQLAALGMPDDDQADVRTAFVDAPGGKFDLADKQATSATARYVELIGPNGRRFVVRPGTDGRVLRGAKQSYGDALLEEVVAPTPAAPDVRDRGA